MINIDPIYKNEPKHQSSHKGLHNPWFSFSFGGTFERPCSIIFLYNPVVFRFRVGLGTRAMRTNVRGTDLEAQGNLTDLEVELVDLYTQTLHVCHICLH